MDASILEDIGLTGAEIKVFVALLTLGSSSAGKVVEKAGLQNAVVHRAFHSLSEKGLITYIYQGKRKQYQSIEPKLLLNFLDEKKKRIQTLLPELEALRNVQQEKPKAHMFQSIRGVRELINSMIDTDATEYMAYGGPQKASEVLGHFFWENFHRRRIEKSIKAKLLFHSSLAWWADELNKNFSLTDVRITDRNFEELTETIVCGNKVAIVIYSEKPFGLLLEEGHVATSYKTFFEMLWESAKM